MDEKIDEEKDKYYKNLLESSLDSMKARWDSIRIIINRKRVDQNICFVPNNILGKHYSTVAEKLANDLPKKTQDDIPSTSHKKTLSSQNMPQGKLFNFNEIDELLYSSEFLLLETNEVILSIDLIPNNDLNANINLQLSSENMNKINEILEKLNGVDNILKSCDKNNKY